MRVQVIRGDGLKQAPGIVNPLLSTTTAAVQRGRNFLDAEGSSKRHIEIAMPFRSMVAVATGNIIEVMDGDTSQIYRAKLAGYSYTVTAPTENTPLRVATRCTVERSMT
jgi:hypothetical protein